MRFLNNTTSALGIGWRPEIAWMIHRRADLRFVEIVSENIDPKSIPAPLQELRDRGIAIIPHGISLSLGGAEPIDLRRVERLARLAEKLESPLVSEHIAFVRTGNIEIGHLMPVQRTRAMLEVLVENIDRARSILPVPLALENISALVEWPDDEMTEGEFVTELLDRTDCKLLLDLSNVAANAYNFRRDPTATLEALPLHRLAYAHLGGGVIRDGVLHDTHAHPLLPGSLSMLGALCARRPINVMLERDEAFPPEGELSDELDIIAETFSRGASQRTIA